MILGSLLTPFCLSCKTQISLFPAENWHSSLSVCTTTIYFLLHLVWEWRRCAGVDPGPHYRHFWRGCAPKLQRNTVGGEVVVESFQRIWMLLQIYNRYMYKCKRQAHCSGKHFKPERRISSVRAWLLPGICDGRYTNPFNRTQDIQTLLTRGHFVYIAVLISKSFITTSLKIRTYTYILQ